MRAHELAQLEPWRQNLGQSESILAPAWRPEVRELCMGEVTYEMSEGASTGWWCCRVCGFCSNATTHSHHKVQHPENYYHDSYDAFFEHRRQQGVDEDTAKRQALFLIGVALRAATATPPNKLTEFVNRLLSMT